MCLLKDILKIFLKNVYNSYNGFIVQICFYNIDMILPFEHKI